MVDNLPDIQTKKPNITIPINQVGIEKLKLPFKLELFESFGFKELEANVSLKTNLREDIRGISMSRLVLTVNEFINKPLKNFMIRELLEKINKNLETTNSFVRFEFNLPIIKKSIISSFSFPQYYKCKFEGHLKNSIFSFYEEVNVQYSSYCSCSAELCKNLFENGITGFPHAQRSFAKILIKASTNHPIWLEELIEIAENQLITIPYPVVKRIDEHEIAKKAAQNTQLVEDAIRKLSIELNKDFRILDWIVKCTHEESIHSHNAIAINFKGIDSGFDESYFI